MDQGLLYSIRMRATTGSQHVSGAERIVQPEKISDTVQLLLARALEKQLTPDKTVIIIESLGTIPFRSLTALDVVTLNSPDMTAARSDASRILRALGISEQAVMVAIDNLRNGAAPSGRAMRGAMIIDARTGERMEPDQERGVRASRFDWSGEALDEITSKLASLGLTHFRTREALALATKVAYAPGLVAELCWSDDPDYTAGYVASREIGYVRFPIMKLPGDTRGGRAFFVDRNDLDRDAFINYLQTETVLIADIGECKPGIEPDEYFRNYR